MDQLEFASSLVGKFISVSEDTNVDDGAKIRKIRANTIFYVDSILSEDKSIFSGHVKITVITNDFAKVNFYINYSSDFAKSWWKDNLTIFA